MTPTDAKLKRYGVEPDLRPAPRPPTPEQKLLQALLALTITECLSYRTSRRISCCCPEEARMLYETNIEALKLIDEQYVIAAGFRNARHIFRDIRKTIEAPLP